MEIIALIILVAAILNLFLGLFVFIDNPKKRLNQLFGFAGLMTAAWGAVNYMMGIGQNLFWVESAYAFGVIVPFMTMLWMLQLCEIKISSKVLLLLGVLDALFFVLSYKTNYIIKHVSIVYAGRFEGETGFLFLPYWIFVIGLLAYIVYSLAVRYGRTKGDKQLQVGYVLIGAISYICVVAVGSFILPSFEIFRYTALDSPSSLFLLFFTALAITKYHLFGVKVIITEFLVAIMGIILAIIPFLMPSIGLKIITFLVFILFCIFGSYLVKATQKESQMREEAELSAIRERALRHEAEDLANNLRHLNQAKTQFLLSTQHHLRSPLTIIQGYLSMVSEGSYGQVPAPVKEKVDISLNTTQKLINLVNEMLDVAHFQMNKGSVVKQPTDILQLVTGIVDDLQKSAESKKIYLRLDKKSPSFPQVAVDSHGIREAIYNIVDNAIKYTQEGGITVAMEQIKDKLRISVIDTGIGLSDHDRRNLFNRTFERGSRAKEVNATGKGIGLYLAGQMIINNNGTIHAESEGRGKGTTFMIELPAISATPATSASAEPAPIPIPKPPLRK